VLTFIALKRSAQLLAISAFLVLVVGNGNAADLPLLINPTQSSMAEFERFLASRHQETASPEARNELFRKFLRWSRTIAERRLQAP